MNEESKQGILYLIGTPLGNLGDISERSKSILADVDIIACEDTRKTGKLLDYLGIKGKKTISYHDHNKEQRTPLLVRKLKNGLNIGLVSDAGCPSISDPGYYFVRKSIDEEIEVISIPGPTALITALQVSGLPSDRFGFYGYLAGKGKRRKEQLKAIAEERGSIILYEAPHRIMATLKELFSCLGDRAACLCREMTKLHEEHIRGSLEEIIDNLEKRNTVKGEITLVIEGDNRAKEKNLSKAVERYHYLVNEIGLIPKTALKLVSSETKVSRQSLYHEIMIK